MNRYYSSAWGRFESPDPYRASGGTGDPQSWNRYAYVSGDPVNFVDPEGLDRCLIGYSSWWPTSGGPPLTTPVFGECGLGPLPSLGRPPIPPNLLNYDDVHGILPKCPRVPVLPKSSNSAVEIQTNVDAAQAFFDQVYSSAPTQALPALLGWLGKSFINGGQWDYKSDPGLRSGSQAWVNARSFGNFNFGAVMEGLGLTYNQAQIVAGLVQTGNCVLNGGESCGTGVLIIKWPFGDQITDAIEIQKGWNYQKLVDSGCK